MAQLIAGQLRQHGHRAVVVNDGTVALRRLDNETFDLVISDVRLPGVDGMTIFRWVKQRSPRTPVILMTAYGSIPEAVDALKNDAAHYLTKPFSIEDLLGAVDEAEVEVAIERERARAREVRAGADPSAMLLGDAPSMRTLKAMLQTVAAAEGPVLISGETGSGKRRVARAIHALGVRREKPFVAINCAALAGGGLEPELFGHERGAGRDELGHREGRLRTADQGALFLDEVAELTPSSQAKLLQVLEDGTYLPLAASSLAKVDVRVIASTSADLAALVAARRFREDLYYRMRSFHVQVPPLRSRRGDLPQLVENILCETSSRAQPPRISARGWAALAAYGYPGNVRELRQIIQHALAMSGDTDIDLCHLPTEVRGGVADKQTDGTDFPTLSSAERDFERDYLLRALREAAWNKTRAAKLLGISRKTLWQKLRALGVEAPPRRHG